MKRKVENCRRCGAALTGTLQWCQECIAKDTFICTKCGVEKPLEDFQKVNTQLGHKPCCRKCHYELYVKARPSNIEKRNEYKLRWKKKTMEKFPEYYRDLLRAGRRACALKKYGLTEDGYIKLLEEQGFACAICDKKIDPNKLLSADHDHTTGLHRGLLCFQCNTVLGNVNEDVDRLRKMIAYLEKYRDIHKKILDNKQ